MAKKKRKGQAARRQSLAIEQAAARAAAILNREVEDVPSPARYALSPRDTPGRRYPGRDLIDELAQQPRRLSLFGPYRLRTVLAMEQANGKPIGRKLRKQLQGTIPDIVSETLCKRKRVRRAVLHARRLTGRGSRSMQRSLDFGRC